jgi:hypothetical protein
MRAVGVCLALALLVSGGGTMGVAGEAVPTITVSLVAGDNSGQVSDPALKELLPLLTANLPLKTYRLLARKSTAVSEGAQVALDGGMKLILTELQGLAFAAKVRKGDQDLLQTRLTLRRDKPVVFGGIAGEGEAKLIIVVQYP